MCKEVLPPLLATALWHVRQTRTRFTASQYLPVAICFNTKVIPNYTLTVLFLFKLNSSSSGTISIVLNYTYKIIFEPVDTCHMHSQNCKHAGSIRSKCASRIMADGSTFTLILQLLGKIINRFDDYRMSCSISPCSVYRLHYNLP